MPPTAKYIPTGPARPYRDLPPGWFRRDGGRLGYKAGVGAIDLETGDSVDIAPLDTCQPVALLFT